MCAKNIIFKVVVRTKTLQNPLEILFLNALLASRFDPFGVSGSGYNEVLALEVRNVG